MASTIAANTLPTLAGASAPIKGAFINSKGEVTRHKIIAGMGAVKIRKTKATKAVARVVKTHEIEYYKFPGVDAETVLGWLLHQVYHAAAADEDGMMTHKDRLGLLATCAYAALPEYFDAMEPYGGATFVLKKAPAELITKLKTSSGPVVRGGDGEDAGEVIHTVHNIESSATTTGNIQQYRAMLSVLIWGFVREPVPGNADMHGNRRRAAIPGLIGQELKDGDICAADQWPTVEEWDRLVRAGRGNRHARAVITRAACKVVFEHSTVDTAEFVHFVGMLEGFGLSVFHATADLIAAFPIEVMSHNLLAVAAQQYVTRAVEEWERLSDFDKAFKKAIEGSDFVPMKGVDQALSGAARMYRKATIPGLDKMVIRGVPSGLAAYLTDLFEEAEIVAATQG